MLAPGQRRPAWLRRTGFPRRCTWPAGARRLPLPRHRATASQPCERCAPCAASTPTIRRPTRAAFGDWLARARPKRRAIDGSGALIARPTLNLQAGRRIARAGRPGVPDRAVERRPRPATSATRACRCRRSTIARRAARSPVPESTSACAGVPRRSRPSATAASGSRASGAADGERGRGDRRRPSRSRRRSAPGERLPDRRRLCALGHLADRQPPRRLRPPRARAAVRRGGAEPGAVASSTAPRAPALTAASTSPCRCRPPTPKRDDHRRPPRALSGGARRAAARRARRPCAEPSSSRASTQRRSAPRPARGPCVPARGRRCRGCCSRVAGPTPGWPATMEGAVRSGHAAAEGGAAGVAGTRRPRRLERWGRWRDHRRGREPSRAGPAAAGARAAGGRGPRGTRRSSVGACAAGSGMGPRRARRAAHLARESGGGALLIAGFCGALDPELEPGDIVLASELRGPTGTTPCGDPTILAGVLRRGAVSRSHRAGGVQPAARGARAPPGAAANRRAGGRHGVGVARPGGGGRSRW